jgi:DNA-binding CsgD family transcriptional regulator
MDDDGEELTAGDIAVYRAVLRAPGSGFAQVARAMTSPADELDKPIARLTDLGLIRVGDDDRLTAISPMLAEATVLGGEDLELGARRAAVERRRDAIRRLVPHWNTAFAATDAERVVDIVTDQSEIANVLMHYAERCESELLSMAPGRRSAGRAQALSDRTLVASRRCASRGVSTRAIYQQVALRDGAAWAHLSDLVGLGARIRLSPVVPGRGGLVVDRSLALLPVPTDVHGGQGLAIVREPHVVAWVIATFEQLWGEATPLADVATIQHVDDPELDATRVAILRLMAEGEKDEAISRRLSISVRTCRRHIADYMAQVGATSRFQAGVIASRSGHIDAGGPHR